jgi:hypothetical protein
VPRSRAQGGQARGSPVRDTRLGGLTPVRADLGGADSVQDMVVRINGVLDLMAADFIL